MRRAYFAKERTVDLAACLALFALCIVLYKKIAKLWWMWDDPLHLNLLLPSNFATLFFSPRFWRAYHAHVYTPLQLVSLKIDLNAFGLNARGFYPHQLAAVSLCSVLLYLGLRRTLDPLTAIATALLGVLGPAFARTVPQLMTRHYFEGLLFVIAAANAFASRRAILSGAFYFVSMLAKEVFVPLPLLLIAIYPRRWRDLFPHGIALMAYSTLRVVMLGPHLQTYGYTVAPQRWPVEIVTAPFRMVRAFAGDAGPAGVCLVIVVLVCVVLLFVGEANQRIVIVAAAAAAILPILPVSIDMQSRYVLVAWLLAAIAVGRVLGRYTLLVVVVALFANRIQWTETMRESRRMSDEARAFTSMSSTELLYMPLTPPATIMELRNLTHSDGRWLYDQQPLCAKRVTADRIIAYDARSRRLHEARSEELAADCASIRSAPLSVELTGAGDRVFWKFGPYRDGTYRIILADGLQGFNVPRDVGFRLSGVTELGLRVRYDSPAGWATYSPDLVIDVAHSRHLLWRR